MNCRECPTFARWRGRFRRGSELLPRMITEYRLEKNHLVFISSIFAFAINLCG